MPYLQLDVNGRYGTDVKKLLAQKLCETYEEMMQVDICAGVQNNYHFFSFFITWRGVSGVSTCSGSRFAITENGSERCRPRRSTSHVRHRHQ